MTQAVSIAVGRGHACAEVGARPHSNVYCWGQNTKQQLGLGSVRIYPTNLVYHEAKRRTTESLRDLNAGGYHSCGSTNAAPQQARVKCWGSDEEGQLGWAGSSSGTPQFPNLGFERGGSTIVAVGGRHTLVSGGGSIFAFGDNEQRQCAHSFRNQVDTPDAIEGLAIVTGGAAGDNHTCVIAGDRSVRCWGQNDRGQLGRGETSAATHESATVMGLSGNQ